MRLVKRTFVGAVCAIAFAAVVSANPPRYVYIDMGGIDEDAIVNEAEAINEHGVATGISFYLQIEIPPKQVVTVGRAFLKFPGEPMIDIGDQPEINTFWGNRGWDINDHNVVVGSATWNPRIKVNPTTGSWYSPGVMFKDGEVIDLGLPEGALGGVAYAVNNKNQIVGGIGQPQGLPAYRAFLWENGTLRYLDGLGPLFSRAWDINDSGHIVGEAALYNGSRGAFLLRDGEVIKLAIDTPNGGNGSKAFAINELDQVVGTCWFGAFIWEDGVITQLPQLDQNLCSRAFDVNDFGDVVGECYSLEHAVIWHEGEAYNLYDIVRPQPEGVRLWQARGINNRGQIVGIATMSGGRERAFLLEPVTPDFNHDNAVTSADLAHLLVQWSSDDPYTDLNGDGVVNGADLANLLANWGPIPPREPYDWTALNKR